MTGIRPNRKTADGKEVDYINLSFNGVLLSRGSDESELNGVDESFAELLFLSAQECTALMAVKLEHKAISWAMSNIHDQQFFNQIQYLLNANRLMHSPTRSQSHVQAERDSAALAADSVGFIAQLSGREKQYFQKEMVIQGENEFVALKDIPTALEELTDEVNQHGF